MHRKSVTLILIFLLAQQLFAQELSKLSVTGTPKKLASEMVAVRDNDGNYCAGIQFISDMDGYSYDSYNGVVRMDDNPGKDMVFVTAGERVVEVYKQGYEPLKIILSEYDIQLDNRDVWQIKIDGDKKTGNSLPVTFMVEPEDARLTVDGESIENTRPVMLNIGEHQIKAERENYQTLNKTIKVSKQKVLFQFELEEIQDAGVQITSNPPGAEVTLDGVKLGETPISSFYPAGQYNIELRKEGYVPVTSETITIKAPTTTKNYTLEENVGYLTVKTRPEATVRFNGDKVEANTRIKLNPSVVNVKVTMPKAETLEESVVIKRNDDKTIELIPDIQTGTIQVAPTPFDAKVELTGDAGEHYTAGGMKVFSDIPVGTYQLEVSKEGYQTYESEINLTANDKVTRNPKLKKGPDIKKIAGMELVKVEGGCFDMGCTSEQTDCGGDEKPVHEVCVDDFYISKTEVTYSQFKEFIQETSYKTDAEKRGYSYIYDNGWKKKNGVTWKDDVKGNRRSQNEYNHPVIHVSWNDAKAFAEWAEGRLPTEAEWEYAARGGNKSRGYKYAGSNDIDRVAWYDGNSGSKTHPVGTKQPNELGLYDMSGNVWEWCSDWYDSDYYEDSRRDNPQGPSGGSKRVLRGGSWYLNVNDCRVALRGRLNPGNTSYDDGFRIAR